MSKRGGKAEQRALDAYARLTRAADLLVARSERALLAAPTGGRRLSHSQLMLLATLRRTGPLHQHDLGTKLVRSKANVTALIDGLQRAGLVHRERNATDRRYVAVHLTPAGELALDAVYPAHAGAVADALLVLSNDEQERLARLCRKLAKGMRAQARASAAPGVADAAEPVGARGLGQAGEPATD